MKYYILDQSLKHFEAPFWPLGTTMITTLKKMERRYRRYRELKMSENKKIGQYLGDWDVMDKPMRRILILTTWRSGSTFLGENALSHGLHTEGEMFHANKVDINYMK